MSLASEPTALGLVAAGQARLETAVAEMRGEINAKLDTKANTADLEGIRKDLVAHRADTDKRLDVLEADRDARSERAKVHELRDNQVFSKRQKFWATVGLMLVVAATIVGPIVGTLVGGH